jgi:hypothetical protein
MTDGENAAMKAVQASCLDAPEPSPFVHADSPELLERDHAVLPRRDSRDFAVPVAVGTFPTHVGG